MTAAIISRKPSAAAAVGTSVCGNMHIEEPRGTFGTFVPSPFGPSVRHGADLDQISLCPPLPQSPVWWGLLSQSVLYQRFHCVLCGNQRHNCVLVYHHNRRAVYRHDWRNPYPTARDSWISLDFTLFVILITIVITIVIVTKFRAWHEVDGQ